MAEDQQVSWETARARVKAVWPEARYNARYNCVVNRFVGPFPIAVSQGYLPEPEAWLSAYRALPAPTLEASDPVCALPANEEFVLWHDDEGDYVIEARARKPWQFLAAHGTTPDEAVYAMRDLLALVRQEEACAVRQEVQQDSEVLAEALGPSVQSLRGGQRELLPEKNGGAIDWSESRRKDEIAVKALWPDAKAVNRVFGKTAIYSKRAGVACGYPWIGFSASPSEALDFDLKAEAWADAASRLETVPSQPQEDVCEKCGRPWFIAGDSVRTHCCSDPEHPVNKRIREQGGHQCANTSEAVPAQPQEEGSDIREIARTVYKFASKDRLGYGKPRSGNWSSPTALKLLAQWVLDSTPSVPSQPPHVTSAICGNPGKTPTGKRTEMGSSNEAEKLKVCSLTKGCVHWAGHEGECALSLDPADEPLPPTAAEGTMNGFHVEIRRDLPANHIYMGTKAGAYHLIKTQYREQPSPAGEVERPRSHEIAIAGMGMTPVYAAPPVDAYIATLEAQVAALEKERDEALRQREIPHVNKEYGTDPISDKRLAEMCQETKWWKHDKDEIYRVVHELRDLRASLSAAAGERERERAIRECLRSAVVKAADEICRAYDVSTPRGVHYANDKRQTIAIIMEQAILALLPPQSEGKDANR